MPSKVNLNRFQRFAGEQYSDCDHSHPIRRGLQFCADAVQCLEFYDSVDLKFVDRYPKIRRSSDRCILGYSTYSYPTHSILARSGLKDVRGQAPKLSAGARP